MSTKLPTSASAILFDLDGTLLDTAADLGAAANHLLEQAGLPLLSAQLIRQTASQGALALIRAGFGKDLGETREMELRKAFLDYYENNINIHSCYFPGAEGVLERLEQQGLPWGIVTNKPHYLTLLLQDAYPLLAKARTTVSGDTLSVRKPHPAPLELAAKEMAVDCEDCHYVGDARTDMIAANDAGMISVAANYGYIPAQDPVAAWPAKMIIDHCDDLLDLI